MKEYYERRLPHWQPPGAIVFLTFRLFGSLPKAALDRLAAEKARLEAMPPRPDETHRDRALREGKHLFALQDRELDDAARGSHSGPVWLRRSDVAALVRQTLRHAHGKRYIEHRYVIMPNHMHWLIEPLPKIESEVGGAMSVPLQRPPEYRFLPKKATAQSAPEGGTMPSASEGVGVLMPTSPDLPWEPADEYWALPTINRSVKTFSSRIANQLLGRTGSFWQEEGYDHWVRDEGEFWRIVAYMDRNPVTAGLCQQPEDWQWSSAAEDNASTLSEPKG